jgi:DNA-binding beta-propeller fold protein YncE
MSAVRFGEGSLRFELVEGWEHLPAGMSHPDVAAVSTDADGRVYLFCRGDHPVMVYESDGTFVDTWGEGRFSYRTHGMFMTDAGELLLVDDLGSSVGRWSRDGELLRQLGPAGEFSDTGWTLDHMVVDRAGPPYNRPTNAALAPSGEVYVSDGYGNSRVHRFSADGELIGSWGEPGSGPGEFRTPHSVWVLDDGRVLVADRQNERIQVFDAEGDYLTEWTDVQRPQDLYVDSDGLVYVCELAWPVGETSYKTGPITQYAPGRLSVLDPEGNCLVRWSTPDLHAPGAVIAAHGLCVDREGSVYLAMVTDTIGVRPGLVGRDAPTLLKFARV